MSNPFKLWLDVRALAHSEVAAAMGVAPAQITRWTRPNFIPRPTTALRILRFTGGDVTYEDFLGLDAHLTKLRKTPEFKSAQLLIEAASARREENKNAERKKTSRRPRAKGTAQQAIGEPEPGSI